MMDWALIEREVHARTSDLMSSKRPASSSSSSWNNNNYNNSNSSNIYNDSSIYQSNNINDINMTMTPVSDTMALSKEVQELRSLLMQQNRKIMIMEKMFLNYNDVLESTSSSSSSFSERLDTLEHDTRNMMKLSSSTNKDRNEATIITKQLAGKMQLLEDYIRGIESDYTSKEAFSQLLESTVEQVKQMGLIAESAKSKSSQSTSVLESLLTALSELKGTGGSGFRLDFLTSLSGDRQRDLVVRLVMDSLQHSIGVSIRQQITHVTDEISASFRPLFENLQQSQNQSQEATHQKCLTLCTTLGNKVDRCSDAITKLEQSFQSIRKQQLIISNDIDGFKQSIQVNETSLQGLRDTLSTQQTLLDMVQTTAQQTRQLQTTEIQGLRETISSQLNTNSSVEKGFKAFHSDNDARQKDMADSVSRLQNVIDDMKRSHSRTSESMKNEIIDIIKAEVAGDLGAVLTANKAQKQRDQTVDVTIEKIQSKVKALDQMFQEKLEDIATLRTELAGSNISTEEVYKTKLQQKIDDDLKVREMSAKLTSLEKAVTQIKLSNNTNQSASTSATSASLAKMDMVTDLQQEITVVHNTNANMKDEQEKMMQQLAQLSQRIGLLSEADQTTQVTTGKIVESEARIRLELDDLKRIQILKLQSDMHERFESLATSHKKMIQTQERLRQGTDTLQEELISVRDVLSSQEKSITTVEGDVVQLREALNIQPSLKSVNEKDVPSLKPKTDIKESVENVTAKRSPIRTLPQPTSPYEKKSSIVNFVEKSREDDDEGSDIFSSNHEKKMKPENDDDDSSLSEKEKDNSFASSPPKSAPQSPMKQSASDVLQSQLKLQIEKEQKKAYENAVAKKSIKEVSGPPVSVLTTASTDSNEEKKDVSSQQPLVSGSLLTSSRNRDTVSRGRVPTLTGSNKNDIPIYASALVNDNKDTNNNTSSRREDSIQCPHCLRRYSKTEINIHTSSCTLRTEFCKYGCGSKIRTIKMAKHYEICPKKPIDNLDNSFDSDSHDDDDDDDNAYIKTPKSNIGDKKQLNDDD